MSNQELSLEEIMALSEEEYFRETDGGDYGEGEFTEEEILNDPHAKQVIDEGNNFENSPEGEGEGEGNEGEGNEPEPVTPPATPQEEEPKPQDPLETKPQETNPEEDELREMLKRNYQLLASQGAIDVDEDFEFDGSPQALKEAFEKTKEKRFKEVSDQVWELLPRIIEGREQDYVTDFNKLDLSDEDTQRELIYNDLKVNTKFSEERIRQLVERTADMGMLAEESQGALMRLKDHQEELRKEAAQQALDAQKQREQEFQQRRSTVQDAIKDSSAIHGKRKTKVEAFMFNPIKRGDQIETDYHRKLKIIANNPQFEVELANFIYDFDEKKGFDYSRVSKKAKSKQVDEFEEQLNSIFSIKDKMTGKPPTDSSDNFDFEMWHRQHDGELYE